MIKFEYLTEFGNCVEDEWRLNELGEEGWEFVDYYSDVDMTLFKRIKCENDETDISRGTTLKINAEYLALEKEYTAALLQFRNAQRNHDIDTIRTLSKKLSVLNQKLSKIEAEQDCSVAKDS